MYLRRPKQSRKTTFVVLVTVWLMAAGCGDDDVLSDARVSDASFQDSFVADSIVADSTILLDTSSDAPAPNDASSPDAVGMTCVGACRSPDDCTDQICVLESEVTQCISGNPRLSAIGELCASLDQCISGLACFARNDGGRCSEFCCPGEGTCPQGRECVRSSLVTGLFTSWGECVPVERRCDVVAEESRCLPTEGCYIVSGEGETQCLSAGSADVGMPCAQQEDCSPGLFCGGTVGSTCVRICELDKDDCPSLEGECQAYAQSPEGTGLCTL